VIVHDQKNDVWCGALGCL